MIEIGLTEGRDDIELFSHERDAVLKTLNDSPQRLIDLRYALDRDHRDRH